MNLTVEQQLASCLMPLVDDRAYPLTLPQHTAYPAITWHRVASRMTEEASHAGWVPQRRYGRKSVYQVVIWTKRYSEGVALLRQCKTAIESQVSEAVLEEAVDGYEHELQLYTVIQEYTVWNELEGVVSTESPDTEMDLLLESIKTDLNNRLAVSVTNDTSTTYFPCVMLDINDIGNGPSKGDGRFALTITFQGRCVAQSKNASAELATEMLQAIDHNKWAQGQALSFPENLVARFEFYLPHMGAVWQVTWQQTLYRQTSHTDSDVFTSTPTSVYTSESPHLGTDHQHDYEPL